MPGKNATKTHGRSRSSTSHGPSGQDRRPAHPDSSTDGANRGRRPGGPAVYLHVGGSRTGTAHLQDVLWKNRAALAADGVLYPLERHSEHVAAASDLRGLQSDDGWNPQWEGAWLRIAERARTWTGSGVVISDELLAGATEQQARQAVESLRPAEVHVVLVARDLARQLPSDWQEQVKHQNTATHEQFVDHLIGLGAEAAGPSGDPFSSLYDAPSVLETWRACLPPERLHVVTVPRANAPNGLVWRRFAELIGVDPGRYEIGVSGEETSMGAVETELIRRVNLAVGDRLGDKYDALVRFYLADTILASRPDPMRIALPREHYSWVLENSQRIVARLREGGYDVVGDLDELLPVPPPAEGEPDGGEDVTLSDLLDAAIESTACILEHWSWAMEKESRPRDRVQEAD
ncbi:MAG: hypothetical protein GEU93_22035 [Propionibacteriales bacterium]|nr:hypothetical protein [Propionibacteriales bacterium]